MIEWIREFFNNYGLLALFIVILLEYACFPIPSEIVLPMAGLMSVELNIAIGFIIVLSIVAGLIGALICYAIGYYGGVPFIDKLTKRFPKTKKSLDFATIEYNKYANVSVCIGRVIPLCRTYISFVAGISKQNIYKYMLYSFIGISIWNTVLISIGYLFYDNIGNIIEIYKKYQLIALLLLFVFGVIFIISYTKSKHKKLIP